MNTPFRVYLLFIPSFKKVSARTDTNCSPISTCACTDTKPNYRPNLARTSIQGISISQCKFQDLKSNYPSGHPLLRIFIIVGSFDMPLLELTALTLNTPCSLLPSSLTPIARKG